MTRIAVKPEVLRWAQERSGLDLPQIEKRYPKYGEWLEGTTQPTLSQLKGFAKQTMTPLGRLFLDAPIEDTLPIPDFRTLDDLSVEAPSPNLLETIYTMRQRQRWMREYLLDTGSSPLPLVGLLDQNISIEDAALKVREALGLRPEWSKKSPNFTTTFRLFRRAVENAGILLFFNKFVGSNSRRKLSVSEFRGFVLIDEYAPLIFINASDAKAAQMFTIAHEIIHVMLASEGLSNLPHLTAGSRAIERFCNSVAAEFLVPKDILRADWNQHVDSWEQFQRLAGKYKVSSIVVGRRALDLDLVDAEDFFSFYDHQMELFKKRREEEREARKESETPITQTAIQKGRLDQRFLSAVVRSAGEGKLLYRDAFSLTGLGSKTFQKFSDEFGA